MLVGGCVCSYRLNSNVSVNGFPKRHTLYFTQRQVLLSRECSVTARYYNAEKMEALNSAVHLLLLPQPPSVCVFKGSAVKTGAPVILFMRRAFGLKHKSQEARMVIKIILMMTMSCQFNL